MDELEVRQKISSLSYRELQDLAKRFLIRANQKKPYLIEEVIRASTVNDNRFVFNVNDGSVTGTDIGEVLVFDVKEHSSPLEKTFTIEEKENQEPSRGEENKKLSDDEKMDAGDANGAVMAETDDKKIEDTNEGSALSVKSTRKLRSRPVLSITARFKRKHEKLIENVPDIRQDAERIRQRHALHLKNVPSVFQRLATPKSIAREGGETCTTKTAILKKREKLEVTPNRKISSLGYKFGRPVDPKTLSFAFDKRETDSTNVEPEPSKLKASKLPKPVKFVAKPLTRYRLPKVDVKTLSKRLSRTKTTACDMGRRTLVRSTIPQLSKRMERLATPRGAKTNILTNSEEKLKNEQGRLYVPYHGKLEKFVDTSVISDSRFLELRSKGALDTINDATARRSQTRRETVKERKRRRELLVDMKRDVCCERKTNIR
ncbi:hypothetical protein AB6A40_007734 [Gnathostoma spinigerum]|uniref:Uncharacterized protein n=1 Tax=Gnathostoma spinigerum TaxID=75299 RepID=A0ABD6ENB1_9BILA